MCLLYLSETRGGYEVGTLETLSSMLLRGGYLQSDVCELRVRCHNICSTVFGQKGPVSRWCYLDLVS